MALSNSERNRRTAADLRRRQALPVGGLSCPDHYGDYFPYWGRQPGDFSLR